MRTELVKIDNIRLNDSMIKVNDSISSLNGKTETFYTKQSNYNLWQKRLTGAILLSSIIYFWRFYENNAVCFYLLY